MAKKDAPAPAGTWYVLSPLHHDGKAHAPGDAVQLPDDTAEALQALGVVSSVAPVADAPAEGDPA